jgi:hypothetical protein
MNLKIKIILFFLTIAISDSFCQEYYTFTDGKKYEKAKWLNPNSIKYFDKILNVSNDTLLIIFDCTMEKLSSKYTFEKVRPFLEIDKNQEKYLELFIELKVFEIIDSCAKYLNKNLSVNWENTQNILENKSTFRYYFKTQIKYEFEKDPEIKELLKLVDEDNFYECLINTIFDKKFNTESLKLYINSDDFTKDIVSCYKENLK